MTIMKSDKGKCSVYAEITKCLRSENGYRWPNGRDDHVAIQKIENVGGELSIGDTSRKFQKMLGKEMKNASAIAALSSLAYDTRLETIQLLAAAGDDGLAAGEIARRLGVQQSTLSDHLKALSSAGVVTSERKGRSIVYRANTEAMLDLIEFMRETCIIGQPTRQL